METPLDKIFGNSKCKLFKSRTFPSQPTPLLGQQRDTLEGPQGSRGHISPCGPGASVVTGGPKVRPNSKGWGMKRSLAEFTVKSAPRNVGWDFLVTPDF